MIRRIDLYTYKLYYIFKWLSRFPIQRSKIESKLARAYPFDLFHIRKFARVLTSSRKVPRCGPSINLKTALESWRKFHSSDTQINWEPPTLRNQRSVLLSTDFKPISGIKAETLHSSAERHKVTHPNAFTINLVYLSFIVHSLEFLLS